MRTLSTRTWTPSPSPHGRNWCGDRTERRLGHGPRWREVFTAVPRHLFVPYYYVGSADGRGQDRLWRDSPDPYTRERWLRGVYTDGPLATRLRDGELLSSSSQPSLMARMLAELRVTDGDHVLEIGAGPATTRPCSPTGSATTTSPPSTWTRRSPTPPAPTSPTPATARSSSPATAPEEPPNTPPTTASSPPAPCPRSPSLAAPVHPRRPHPGPLATGLITLTVHDETHAEGNFLDTAAYFVPLRGAEPSVRGEIPTPPATTNCSVSCSPSPRASWTPGRPETCGRARADPAESATA